MVPIPKRATDIRPIIGAVVFFAILGSAIFGIYYFTIARPAAEELEAAKQSALNRISLTLAALKTDQASLAAPRFSAQVLGATSKSEVESILVDVTATVQLEQKRKEFLDRADSATNGTFLSIFNVEELATLSRNLKNEINAKTSIRELDEYSIQIDEQATSTWRAHFTTKVRGMVENIVVMKRNTPPSWEYVTRENALAWIAKSCWRTLREVDFENPPSVGYRS